MCSAAGSQDNVRCDLSPELELLRRCAAASLDITARLSGFPVVQDIGPGLHKELETSPSEETVGNDLGRSLIMKE